MTAIPIIHIFFFTSKRDVLMILENTSSSWSFIRCRQIIKIYKVKVYYDCVNKVVYWSWWPVVYFNQCYFSRMSAVDNQLTARCFQIVPNFRMFGSTTFCLSVVLFGNAGLLCQQTTRWYRWRSRTCFFYDQNVKNIFMLLISVGNDSQKKTDRN